jgi:hypothetical protein
MDMPVPTHILTRLQETEKMLKDYDEGKKLEQRYNALKRRLEVCREARPVARENLEAQRAVQYHQSIKQQIQKKLDDVEQSIENHRRKYEKDVEILKEKYERDLANLLKTSNYFVTQDELRKSKIVDNMTYVENRLKAAEERAVSGNLNTTKEEIGLVKEMDEIIKKYAEIQPTTNLEIIFPDYKNIRSPLSTNPPTPPSTGNPLAPSSIDTPFTPSSQPKKEIKISPEEEIIFDVPTKPLADKHPVTQLSDKDISKMDEEQLFGLLRPNAKNPYSNVISNTKLKRGIKQTG